MPTYQYQAVPFSNSVTAHVQSGELEAPSPIDARGMLRQIGLRPVSLRVSRSSTAPRWAIGPLHGVLLNRRLASRAEFADDLATLLQTGVPLVESLETVRAASTGRRERLAATLTARVRQGDSLSAAMRDHPTWFDGVDQAMVTAGEQAGTLPLVLRSLAERHLRTGEVSRKLMAALAYPALVLVAGVGVATFLGAVTLPKLATVLSQSKVEVPWLTRAVMGFGQFTVGGGWLLAFVPVVILPLMVWWAARSSPTSVHSPIERWIPLTARRGALAAALRELALLLRSGVPLVSALRVVAPTVAGWSAAALRTRLARAADRIEGGDSLASAFDDPRWFGPVLRRTLEIAQAGGELPDLLAHAAESESSRARAMADRLAAFLEPAAIIALAFMVGLVVMSAILPIIRLQEIVR